MSNQYEIPPFGAPIANFMQTGSNAPIIEPTEEFNEDPINAEQPISNNEPNPTFVGSPPFANQSTLNQNQSTKYQIIDLFWLINPVLYTQPQKLIQNQAQFVVISYNISFGNLRISFFNIGQGAIQGSSVFLNNMQRITSGTIYPASAFCINNNVRISTVCVEQMFKSTGEDWQQSRPKCTVEKNENLIRLTIEDQKSGKYFYDFMHWQREAFIYACQFCYTTGMYLHGLNSVNR